MSSSRSHSRTRSVENSSRFPPLVDLGVNKVRIALDAGRIDGVPSRLRQGVPLWPFSLPLSPFSPPVSAALPAAFDRSGVPLCAVLPAGFNRSGVPFCAETYTRLQIRVRCGSAGGDRGAARGGPPVCLSCTLKYPARSSVCLAHVPRSLTTKGLDTFRAVCRFPQDPSRLRMKVQRLPRD